MTSGGHPSAASFGMDPVDRSHPSAEPTLSPRGLASSPVERGAPPRVPKSGRKLAWTEIKHGLGILTYPWWRPVQEIARDTLKLRTIHQIPVQHIRGWVQLWNSAGVNWERWNKYERVRVLKQDAIWGGLFSISAAASLTAGNIIPLSVISCLYWLKAHDLRISGRPLPHFDLARWALRLPQKQVQAEDPVDDM